MIDTEEFDRTARALAANIQEYIAKASGYKAQLPHEYVPAIIELLIHKSLAATYDLVIVVTSGWSWIKYSPTVQDSEEHQVLHLTPRPKGQCPSHLDTLWTQYNRADVEALGRKEICPDCNYYVHCQWVWQWSREMQRAKIVVFDHGVFEGNPTILELIQQTSAKKGILVLFEDANIAHFSYRFRLGRQELDKFYAFVCECAKEEWADNHLLDYKNHLESILSLTPESISTAATNPMTLSREMLSLLQKENLRRQSLRQRPIRFPIYGIQNFSIANPQSHFLEKNGDISYYLPPTIIKTSVVFGPQSPESFFQHKLRNKPADIPSPSTLPLPLKTRSRIVNLASVEGSGSQLKRNRNRTALIQLYAQLIEKKHREGKKVLVVASKNMEISWQIDSTPGRVRYESSSFLRFFVNQANQFYRTYSQSPLHLVAYKDDSENDFSNPEWVSVIGYGDAAKLGSTGMFSDYDVLICVSSFYYNQDLINTLFWESYPATQRHTLQINISDQHPRRRIVTCPENPDIVPAAQEFMELLESGQIHKTISCINPLLAEREVYLAYCGELADLEYAREYKTLSEMHRDLGLLSMPELKRIKQRELLAPIRQLRLDGKTQQETAIALAVPRHIIQRLWRDADPADKD